MRYLFVSVLVLAVVFSNCFCQGEEKRKPSPSKLIFIVDGLHCENCVTNLKGAIKSVKGVEKVEVSLKEKRAFVVLDETQTPLSSLIAQSQKKVHYRLTLLLPIENWGKVDQNKAINAVKAVKGIAEVKANNEGLLVKFQPKETVRYNDLSKALRDSGFKVLDTTVKVSDVKGGDSPEGSCCDECESKH
ncbi:MAG: heavy-metal-associated domain-containing protein [Armatimonadota bacterium]